MCWFMRNKSCSPKSTQPAENAGFWGTQQAGRNTGYLTPGEDLTWSESLPFGRSAYSGGCHWRLDDQCVYGHCSLLNYATEIYEMNHIGRFNKPDFLNAF